MHPYRHIFSSEEIALVMLLELLCLSLIGWRLWLDWRRGGWAADKAGDWHGNFRRRLARFLTYWGGLAAAMFCAPAIPGRFYNSAPAMLTLFIIMISILLILDEGFRQFTMQRHRGYEVGRSSINTLYITVNAFLLIVVLMIAPMVATISLGVTTAG